MDDSTRIETVSLESSNVKRAVSFNDGCFVYDSHQKPFVSSGHKHVYRGVYYPETEVVREPLTAVAKFYEADAVEKFGRESAALARGSVIGVGPRLLQVAVATPPSGTAALPVIVEEYAGVKLSDAIGGAAIPSGIQGIAAQHLLSESAADEQEKQIAKIMYDLMLHVHRMHANGICHGDLKASNVCVRTIGPQPWDIRATLIDFDLEAISNAAPPRERTAAYYDKLFVEIPKTLGFAGTSRPSLFELDMACLSAVCLEVALGKRIDGIEPAEIAETLETGPGLFRYSRTGAFKAGRIDFAHHLAPCARRAGMTSVERYFAGCEESFMRRARVLAEVELKGGAFLDAENIRRIEANPEMELIRREDDIAHAVFESYCENLRATGEQPDYETFGQQPADLQQSCYGQAADLCEKVSRLGYRLVRADQAGKAASQIALDETQIEAMARWEHERWLNERRSMGWMFGQERDAEKKTSPYLVPYDELDEDVKEARNRAPMRDALKVLAGAGLAIVKV